VTCAPFARFRPNSQELGAPVCGLFLPEARANRLGLCRRSGLSRSPHPIAPPTTPGSTVRLPPIRLIRSSPAPGLAFSSSSRFVLRSFFARLFFLDVDGGRLSLVFFRDHFAVRCLPSLRRSPNPVPELDFVAYGGVTPSYPYPDPYASSPGSFFFLFAGSYRLSSSPLKRCTSLDAVFCSIRSSGTSCRSGCSPTAAIFLLLLVYILQCGGLFSLASFTRRRIGSVSAAAGTSTSLWEGGLALHRAKVLTPCRRVLLVRYFPSLACLPPRGGLSVFAAPRVRKSPIPFSNLFQGLSMRPVPVIIFLYPEDDSPILPWRLPPNIFSAGG